MSAMINTNDSVFGESIAQRPIYANENHSELAFNRFSLLREKNILTDAVIYSIDGKRFNVHRFIMSGTSEHYFSHLLNADEQDNVAVLSLNIDSGTIETIIKFCYSGVVELTLDNVEDVLNGAKLLQIAPLVLLCGDMLHATLNGNNCIRLLEIADRQQIDLLRENALAIITDVLPNIGRLPEFISLNDQQIVGLMRLLLSDQAELFYKLLESLNDIENIFPSSSLNAENQSAIRAAFIAGFLSRNKLSPARPSVQSQLHLQMDQDNKSTSSSESETESESDTALEVEEQLPLVHVLATLNRKTIHLNRLCDIQRKWEKSTRKIQLKHGIESFRDSIMVPCDDEQVVIFDMQNGSISQAQCLTLKKIVVESIPLPDDVKCANLTLFCQMGGMIYCFSRSDQQHYFGYDLKSKSWSSGHIENVKVAKCIVGLKGELFFLGSGYSRSLVRSYHLERKEWMERGTLLLEHKKATCFKGIVLNDAIYVVMTRYDSAKFYNGTEFLVQRFDEEIEGWSIVKRIYYSQYVGHFNLAVAENRLYIFYGDGEVEIYHDDLDEWKKGPAIVHGRLDDAMCMVAVKPNALVFTKQKSR